MQQCIRKMQVEGKTGADPDQNAPAEDFVLGLHRLLRAICQNTQQQSNFNGSNTIGTMKISSRQG